MTLADAEVTLSGFRGLVSNTDGPTPLRSLSGLCAGLARRSPWTTGCAPLACVQATNPASPRGVSSFSQQTEGVDGHFSRVWVSNPVLRAPVTAWPCQTHPEGDTVGGGSAGVWGDAGAYGEPGAEPTEAEGKPDMPCTALGVAKSSAHLLHPCLHRLPTALHLLRCCYGDQPAISSRLPQCTGTWASAATPQPTAGHLCSTGFQPAARAQPQAVPAEPGVFRAPHSALGCSRLWVQGRGWREVQAASKHGQRRRIWARPAIV